MAILFPRCPVYIRIRNGVKSHEEDKESNYVGSNNESWGGNTKSTGGHEYFLAYQQWIAYFEWLQLLPEEAARYSLGWEFQFLVPISGTPILSGIPIPFLIPKIPVGFFFEIPMFGE